MKNVQHKNILKLIDSFESANHYHLILEYFEGITLSQYLYDNKSNKNFKVI